MAVDKYYEAMVGAIERFQQIIQHDIVSCIFGIYNCPLFKVFQGIVESSFTSRAAEAICDSRLALHFHCGLLFPYGFFYSDVHHFPDFLCEEEEKLV